ncbi:MAG: phosphoglycerate kinase [bacterium]
MRTLKEINLTHKNILMRADLDIPNNTDFFRPERMRASIDYILAQSPKSLTLCGHRGRPAGKTNPKLSLKPVQSFFAKIYQKRVRVLENLRFDPREETENPAFAKELGQGKDIFVQECFATLHRKHTSVTLLPQAVPTACIGINLERELTHLNQLKTEDVKRPFVVILGGAKIETKQPLIAEFEKTANKVLLGSKYLGKALDLDTNLIKSYQAHIKNAQTILWNGPVGLYEKEEYATGTKAIAEAVARNCTAFKVVGGNHTIDALRAYGLLNKIDFVSTGGGAMLEYVLGHQLPGLNALQQ